MSALNDECDGSFGDSLALTNVETPPINTWSGPNYIWTLAIGCPLCGLETCSYIEKSGTNLPCNKRRAIWAMVVPSTILDGKGMAIATMKQTAYLYIETNGVWTEMAALENPVGTECWYGRHVALSGDKPPVASSNNVYSYVTGECMP